MSGCRFPESTDGASEYSSFQPVGSSGNSISVTEPRAKACFGVMSGLNRKIPVALKPPFTLAGVAEALPQTLLNIEPNHCLAITFSGFCLIKLGLLDPSKIQMN